MSSWTETSDEAGALNDAATTAERRPRAQDRTDGSADKARALAKLDVVLELGKTLAVRDPVDVEPRRLREATPTLAKLSAASKDAAVDVSAAFPAEAATLSRIQLTCDRLSSAAPYDGQDALDRVWLCRRYRDLYCRLRDLAFVAAEQDEGTGSPHSRVALYRDDPYVRPMFDRTSAFSHHLIGEEGYEAIREEVLTGRTSRYAQPDD